MFKVLSNSWALLLGMMLLMVGNGMQGTLLGVRGGIEEFETWKMSIVMAAYFAGLLGGSRMAPRMIRRVGHVRVFAALGSLVSALLVMFPVLVDPISWSIGRLLLGFCFAGVYVTAESWLNNSATNETRGKTLSVYLVVQMLGVVAAQALLMTGDPSGFILFIIPSILVSISFAPILLSISPTPAFGTAKPMSLKQLFIKSPLGCVGVFFLGGVFAAQFGMASVYGSEAGMTVVQISTFVAAFYIGAVLLQFPIGWLSDRIDRRVLIAAAALVGAVGAVVGFAFGAFNMLLVSAFLIGGTSNPLYALLIAHANDFLSEEDMAAAAGGMVFVNGLGAMTGPLITAWIMGAMGPEGFFIYLAILLIAIASYATYRMTQRPTVAVEDTGIYTPVAATASLVAVDMAQEWAIEVAQDDDANMQD